VVWNLQPFSHSGFEASPEAPVPGAVILGESIPIREPHTANQFLLRESPDDQDEVLLQDDVQDYREQCYIAAVYAAQPSEGDFPLKDGEERQPIHGG